MGGQRRLQAGGPSVRRAVRHDPERRYEGRQALHPQGALVCGTGLPTRTPTCRCNINTHIKRYTHMQTRAHQSTPTLKQKPIQTPIQAHRPHLLCSCCTLRQDPPCSGVRLLASPLMPRCGALCRGRCEPQHKLPPVQEPELYWDRVAYAGTAPPLPGLCHLCPPPRFHCWLCAISAAALPAYTAGVSYLPPSPRRRFPPLPLLALCHLCRPPPTRASKKKGDVATHKVYTK